MKFILIAIGCAVIGLYAAIGVAGMMAGLALAGKIERWAAE